MMKKLLCASALAVTCFSVAIATRVRTHHKTAFTSCFKRGYRPEAAEVRYATSTPEPVTDVIEAPRRLIDLFSEDGWRAELSSLLRRDKVGDCDLAGRMQLCLANDRMTKGQWLWEMGLCLEMLDYSALRSTSGVASAGPITVAYDHTERDKYGNKMLTSIALSPYSTDPVREAWLIELICAYLEDRYFRERLSAAGCTFYTPLRPADSWLPFGLAARAKLSIELILPRLG